MSDAAIAAGAWIGLGVHILVGVLALRTSGSGPQLPMLNLITATCVLAYWANRWFGYLFRGITWYATDQFVPLYARLVCILALMRLTGRYPAVALNWVVFGIDAAVLTEAVLFVTFFRVNRLL
jgi:hypothetical protein